MWGKRLKVVVKKRNEHGFLHPSTFSGRSKTSVHPKLQGGGVASLRVNLSPRN